MLLAAWACTEDPAQIGFRKEVPRVGIFYHEFSIPVKVIQSDSVRTDNVRLTGNEPLKPDLDRIMVGKSNDPIFGNLEAEAYVQFLPPLVGTKLKLNGVTLDKITLTLINDYYFYGDTSVESTNSFQVKRISDRFFSRNRQLFNSTTVDTEPGVIGQASWVFNPDSVRKRINANSDKNTNNDVVDSLYFELSQDFGQELLTKLLTTEDTLQTNTLDAFQSQFKGLAIQPVNSKVVMGFNPGKVASKVRIYYSYIDNATTKKGKYDLLLSIPYCAGSTNIKYDRSSTPLSNLSAKYTPYSPSDGFGYIQSGTGMFAKLDFSDFYTYFDTVPKPLLNSAELIIPVPATTVRNHYVKPVNLYYYFMNDKNRLYRPVSYYELNGKPVEKIDGQFQYTYFAEMTTDYTIRARGDDKNSIRMPFATDTDLNGYRGFLTEFFQTQLRLPSTTVRFPYAALSPADTPFGKSLNGVSFDATQVKLRVYYSKALVK